MINTLEKVLFYNLYEFSSKSREMRESIIFFFLQSFGGHDNLIMINISIPGYLSSNAAAATDIKGSVDYLVSIQTREGNFPCAMDEVRSLY